MENKVILYEILLNTKSTYTSWLDANIVIQKNSKFTNTNSGPAMTRGVLRDRWSPLTESELHVILTKRARKKRWHGNL